MMNKEHIRDLALKILSEVEMDRVESISISEDAYKDGSPYTEINIDYKGGESE